MRVSVGSSTIDTETLEVKRAGVPVAVEPKVFDLLLLLLDNRHRVVSREEIIERIWDGRAVSDTALSSCIKAARRALGDDGASQQVIRTIHRRGFRFVGAVAQGASVQAAPTQPAEAATSAMVGPPHDLSLAVLPFENMSGDPEQEYFSDGLVEDITTALSRFRSLIVISRNSSFSFKGRAVDTRQVGRELGVRYVLQGSVRKAGSRLRITGQLVDCNSGAQIWAGRYDGVADDVFALQDQVTLDVVGEILPKLTQAEIERAIRKSTGHLGAYDCYLRGLAAYHAAGSQGLRKAQALFGQAIALDPDFATPYALSGFSQALLHGMGDGSDPDECARAIALSRRAIELDRDDGIVLAMGTWVEAHLSRNMDAAIELAESAVEVNSNLSFAWAANGWANVWMGRPKVGLECFRRARRLSPLDVNQRFVWTGIATGHYMAGEYELAVTTAIKALQVWRQAPPYRAAAAGAAMAGRMDEARQFVVGLLEVDPGRRLSTLRETLGAYRRAEDVEHLIGGLRLAGLPE